MVVDDTDGRIVGWQKRAYREKSCQKVRKSCASALRQIMAKLEQKSVDGTQQGFMVG